MNKYQLSLNTALFSSLLTMGAVILSPEEASATVIECQGPNVVPVPCATNAGGTLQVGGVTGTISVGGTLPVSAASGAFVDGAISSIGTKADTAWASGSGSEISILKAIAQGITAAIPAGTNAIGTVAVSGGTVALSGTVPVSGTVNIGAALPAGTFNIGSVVVSSLPSVILGAGVADVGTFHVFGTVPVTVSSLPALPTGTNSIGTVGVSSLPALPAGTNSIGTVVASGTVALSGTVPVTVQNTVTVAPTGTQAVSGTVTIVPSGTQAVSGTLTTNPAPTTSGGLSVKQLDVANNVTSVAVKASAGQFYGLEAFNNGTVIAYVKLYDAAQGSVTCGGTLTPLWKGMIPAPSSGGGGFISQNAYGVSFSTALTVCITTGIGNTDSAAPAASTYLANFLYK